MPETEYELPTMDDFVLNGDNDQSVWMQCRICFANWEVVNLADALHQWNEHICKEKVR